MAVTTPTVIIRGATVVDENGERRGDVRLEAGRIVEVSSEVSTSLGAIELDAQGAYLLPAFVDLHAHLREPGGEEAETVLSGSRAAALGGYRAVVAMPNTRPAIDSPEAVRAMRAASSDVLCEVVVSAAITIGRGGEQLVPFEELAGLGVHLFTDDGAGVQDGDLMREALTVARRLSVVLAQHCEDASLAGGGHMHEGAWSSRLGICGQDARSEEAMVERDLRLVEQTGATEHFLHLSTAGAIELVRAAKAKGLPVTAEATPHHLALSDAETAEYDPVFKVNPPLRPRRDVLTLRRAILDGTIDAIATDHAPHARQTKDEPFDRAPFGMIGLETAFSVAYSELVRRRHLRIEDETAPPALKMVDLVRLFALQPASIAGVRARDGGRVEAGASADLVVFDPSENWHFVPERGASRSSNSPFSGFELMGRVRHTVIHGEPVVIDAMAQR